MPIRRAVFAWLLLFAWLFLIHDAVPANADDEPNLSELQAKAEKGDAVSQFELGRKFAAGDGVAKDDAAALAWFLKAAQQGHTKAEVSLGSIYAHGFGVEQNWAESIQWYRRAAAKGDTTAEHNLGLDYGHAHGVERDDRQTAHWFRRAADQEHARAAFNLGELYQEGHGVPQSDLEAYVLYCQAASHENLEHIFGKVKLDELIAKRDALAAKLTDTQRAEADRRVAHAIAAWPVHPRRFGVPGGVGPTRGWYVWLKWDPETRMAEVTKDPPGGEVYSVRVPEWATTYRHLAYGASFDDLLPGEKFNPSFNPDERHRRGYLVHYQDEISQMQGHGHWWQVRSIGGAGNTFTARVMAGDKPIDENAEALEFHIDPTCQKWSQGKQVDKFPFQVGGRLYMTWVYRDSQRVAMVITDQDSLETLKAIQQQRIDERLAREGMSGQLEWIDGTAAQVMIFSTWWAQANRLKPGQTLHLVDADAAGRPVGDPIAVEVVSQKNRGTYSSGVNDVVLKLPSPNDAERLWALSGKQVIRIIPVP